MNVDDVPLVELERHGGDARGGGTGDWDGTERSVEGKSDAGNGVTSEDEPEYASVVGEGTRVIDDEESEEGADASSGVRESRD